MTAQAVSDAILAKLRAAIGLRVWTVVPEDEATPYTVVSQIVSQPAGGKLSRAEWHEVEVIDWTTGPSSAAVRSRMKATAAAIDRALLTGVGIADFVPQLMPGATDELHDDGVTWSGSQKFRCLGQPAG